MWADLFLLTLSNNKNIYLSGRITELGPYREFKSISGLLSVDVNLGRQGRSLSHPNVASLDPGISPQSAEEIRSALWTTPEISDLLSSRTLEYFNLSFVLQINLFRVGYNLQVSLSFYWLSIIF